MHLARWMAGSGRNRGSTKGVSTLAEVPSQEVEHPPEGTTCFWAPLGVEAVLATMDGDEIVLDAGRCKGLGHHHGLLVRHVGIAVAVEQECRRVLRVDVADWAVGPEEVGLGLGIVSRHLVRPEAVLPAVEVEVLPVIRALGARGQTTSYGRAGAFDGNLRLLKVEGRGFAVPGADDVAVSVEGDDCRRSGVGAEAGHEGEIAAGGMPDDGDAIRIGMEERRPEFAHPSTGVFEVVDDGRELGLRRQAAVYGDDGEACLQVEVALPGGDVAAVPHDEAAAVDPQHGRGSARVIWSVDIGLDVDVVGVFIGVGVRWYHVLTLPRLDSEAGRSGPAGCVRPVRSTVRHEVRSLFREQRVLSALLDLVRGERYTHSGVFSLELHSRRRVLGLRLGLPKGSLQQSTFELLARAGYQCTLSSRSYYPTMDDPEIEPVLMRAQEIPRYTAAGAIDAGLSGLDWIVETDADVVQVCDLVYSKASRRTARWVVAVAQDSEIKSPKDLEGKRIATEVVNVTKKYLAGKGVRAEVEFSWGATEVKVPDMVDAIVELTETGSSLAANDLRILDTVLETNTKLIANRDSWADSWKREKIETLAMLLQGALLGAQKVGLKMNVARANLDEVLGLIPALRQPTISALTNEEWVAVETVLDEREARDLIPELRKAGAEGIVEYPLNKVIP